MTTQHSLRMVSRPEEQSFLSCKNLRVTTQTLDQDSMREMLGAAYISVNSNLNPVGGVTLQPTQSAGDFILGALATIVISYPQQTWDTVRAGADWIGDSISEAFESDGDPSINDYHYRAKYGGLTKNG